MREFISPGTKFVDLPPAFRMARGGTLRGGRIAYETWGRVNADRSNVVLILTGLSPSAHAAESRENPLPGWWNAMIGPGRPIDTDVWHVVCVNSLGSCHGSTGPASPSPEHGNPYRLDFPALSVEDVADASAAAVRALGFDRLACVIGTSMGGMTSLALVARHPGLVRTHVNISGAVHSLPFSIAIRSLQREAVRTDPNWNEGRYSEASYPVTGMSIARKLGVTAYRSADEWRDRFARDRLTSGRNERDPFGPEFEIEGYLGAHAERFARSYDPNCYLYLSRSMDWFDIGECSGCGVREALSRLRLEKALVIGVESDILFPICQQREIAEGLRAGGVATQFVPLQSPQGHDAFLVDIASFGPVVNRFLSALHRAVRACARDRAVLVTIPMIAPGDAPVAMHALATQGGQPIAPNLH